MKNHNKLNSLSNICTSAVILVLLTGIGSTARAGGFTEQFSDSTDGRFDVSRFLDTAYGFMPVLNVITEPAVGYGAGLGMVFIHRPKEEVGEPLTSPPSMSGVMGFYTENDTWGAGGFYQGHWRRDRFRYMGFAGYVSVNLTYYPPALSEYGIGFDFNLEGGGLVQRLEYRLGDTPWFLGGQYTFFRNKVGFDFVQGLPGFEETEIEFRLGALSPLLTYDSRDYNFTTNRGIYGRSSTSFYAPAFGGDHQFVTGKAFVLGWLPVDPVVCGLRIDVRYSDGDTPFYSQPSVNLRGVPAMRYQNKYAVVVETEERWDITGRWSLTGFAGLGKALGNDTRFGDAELVWAAGGGFRYRLARIYNLFGGIDIARGPEQWAFYIVTGQWWNGL